MQVLGDHVVVYIEGAQPLDRRGRVRFFKVNVNNVVAALHFESRAIFTGTQPIRRPEPLSTAWLARSGCGLRADRCESLVWVPRLGVAPN